MQRKLFVLFAGLVLFSLTIAPVGMAGAQGTLPPTPQPPVSKGEVRPFEGAVQDPDGLWYMPEGAHTISPDHAVVPMAVSSPDDYGYTWDDSVALNWVDTTSGTDTGLSGDGHDNATAPIVLPFSFKYYENTYNQIYITALGYLAFTESSYWDSQSEIPNPSEPNNVIAPYWTPTYIGTGGWVHYMSGGSAPNRYFVVEWHDVKGGDPSSTTGSDDTYRFETILYENGDIVFQYQTMTYNGNYYCGASGIEDSTGLDGLSYVGFCDQAPSNKAVRFYRPAPSARVRINPTQQGSFTQAGAAESFQITVRNTGELGADTYDLTAASAWPVALYAADGVTPLTDSDSDGTVDTGSLAQGSTVTITAKVATPGGAAVGDANSAAITARSSVNTSKFETATLQTAIPAPFAQVYDDGADGAMSLDLIQPNAQVVKKATPDGYYGYDMAVATAPNGNFVYVWEKYRNLGSVYVYEIEYTLLNHYGDTVRDVSKLTDHSGATINTYDFSPSVAVAPNGVLGVVWRHYLGDGSNHNDNIYFATLDASGNLITGPINITNNTAWGNWDTLNVPFYYHPTIAASDDNHFIIGWQEYKNVGSGVVPNIWYAVRDTAGASVFPPTALTSDNGSFTPVLNSLTGGKAILTWHSSVAPDYGIPTYAVLNSSGGISKAATTLGVSYVYETPDAVLLPNGKVALAWPTDTGVQFAILNSSYALESGPISANSPSSAYGYALSATAESSNRVIMTWGGGGQNLFYALGDSAGTFITPPMSYKASADYIDTSYNGQGNAPYIHFTDVPLAYWASGFIERLYGAGITGGFPDGTYRPEDPATRGQMAVFLLKAEHGASYTPPAASPTFTDTSGHWAENWIEALKAEGITSGYADGTYRPDNSVTRAEMAVFLLKAMNGASYTAPTATPTFSDTTGHWAVNWIEALKAAGITSGYPDGTYRPNNSVTRAEMAVFLVKAFGLP